MEKFKIICKDHESGQIVTREVIGERIVIEGVEFFIHSELEYSVHGVVDYWFVTLLETGHYISYDLDKFGAIKDAGIKLKDKAKFREAIKKAKSKHPTIKFPINK